MPMLMRPALEEECWATIAVTLQSSYEWYEAAVESAAESAVEGAAVEGAAVEGGENSTTCSSEKADEGRGREEGGGDGDDKGGNEGGGEEGGGGDHIGALLPSVHRGALEILRGSMAALVALKG